MPTNFELLLSGDSIPSDTGVALSVPKAPRVYKKDLESALRVIRDEATIGVSLSPELATKVEGTFRQFYPYYVSQGLEIGVQSVSVALLGDGRCFRFTLRDGTVEDVSMRECFHPRTPAQRADVALRYETRKDCFRYRDRYFALHSDASGQAPCELTGQLLTNTGIHIDHVPPNTFQAMRDGWLAARGLKLAEIQTVHVRTPQVMDYEHECTLEAPEAGRGIRLADSALAADWIAWHLHYSTLRVVSQMAHSESHKLESKRHSFSNVPGTLETFLAERVASPAHDPIDDMDPDELFAGMK